jgi:hypothetical protein
VNGRAAVRIVALRAIPVVLARFLMLDRFVRVGSGWAAARE